jgi:hypothetical protein
MKIPSKDYFYIQIFFSFAIFVVQNLPGRGTTKTKEIALLNITNTIVIKEFTCINIKTGKIKLDFFFS